MINRDPNYRAASAYEYGDVREFTLKSIVNTEILWSCGYTMKGVHYGIAGCHGPFEALAHVLQEAQQKAASEPLQWLSVPHAASDKGKEEMLVCICRMCGYWEITNALASHPSCPLCPEHEQMVSLSPGVQVSIGKPDNDALSKTTVLEVLNRLNRQYDDHMRSTIRNIRGYDDLRLLAENAGVASRWEAKQDAVKMVADDLGVVLESLAEE